jgi:BMFP domain-containing protein YqiC
MPREEESAPMTTTSRIFDDLGRVLNEAAGVADGVRREVETVIKSQGERFVNDMDLVKREDFDALRELVQAQGEEIAALKKELAASKPGVAPAASTETPTPAAN